MTSITSMATHRKGAMRSGVCLIAVLAVVNSFNLDPRFSVIKKGPEGSYFGYSVAEHQTVDEFVTENPEDHPTRENLLLIGAPKADSEVLGIENTGAIYKCPADTTNEDDCEQLTDDPFKIPPETKYNENLTDQWLGVVVRSQGKGRNILVCAHRYMRDYFGLGICYTLLQSMDYQEKWRPCLGRPMTRQHQEFGVCQAGISGMLTKDDGFLVGAPGSFDWRGVFFKANVSSELGADKSFYLSPVPTEEGKPPDESTGPAPPVGKYAYLGYSVASGTFDKSGNRYYVSGAPRSSQAGEVVLFTQVPGKNLMYAENQILKGKRDFSAFGHEVLALDLTNDGYEELIIGAPFYHKPNVGGAIYVYPGGTSALNKYSKPVEILSRQMKDEECKKLKCEHARFGFSLAAAGDLNGDGFQDFAVGAPYEGNGTVYIFHGSAAGVVKEYAQRISAESIPSASLASFGHSLSGGMDLDSNGYPDLLVGSYAAAEIALIRARPIIHLHAEVKLEPDIIDLSDDPYCKFDSAPRHCVQITICLKFTAEPKDRFTSQPKITYKIETETQRSIPRVVMKGTNGRVKEAVLMLNRQTDPKPSCVPELTYLEKGFQDKLNPLLFDISYSLEDNKYVPPSPGQPLTDINDYPILATAGAGVHTTKTAFTAKVEFVKDCDDVCDSNLQFQASLNLPRDSQGDHILSQGSIDTIILSMSVTNLNEAAYLTNVYIEKPETLQYQGSETLNATNKETEVKCDKLVNNASIIECLDIGNPLASDETVKFLVKLDPAELTPSKTEHQIVVWVNTTSQEMTPESDRFSMSFRVIIKAEMSVSGVSSPDDPIIYSGSVRGESAIKIEDEIGPAVNHTYVVTNFGDGTVPRSTLTILWPYQTENNEDQGKHLLYLMQAPQVMNGPAECIIEPKIINQLGITVNPDFIIRPPSRNSRTSDIPAPVLEGDKATRRKREAEVGESRGRRSGNRREVIFDCRRKTAKCHEIKCNIGEMKKNQYVEIKIRARLWDSTLIQDYMNVGEVKIRSKGELYIDPALNVESKQSTNENYAVTIAIPDVKEQQGGQIEWWIILVAVLAGLILLIGLILLLWKLGFFKRKKPEDMATYKVEVEKQKDFDEDDV